MGYKQGDYEKYHASPRMKKERAARNKARRQAVREGKAHKGDGMHLDHKDGNPMNNRPSNKRMLSAQANRRKQ